MTPPKIGIVPGYFHADPDRTLYKNKTLLYVDEAITRWIQTVGAYPFLLPTPEANLSIDAIVAGMDGLLLQGGPDVSPESYGEEPMRKEWSGDDARDRYEFKLVHACLERSKPILGVCRGIQSLNVALGGTLFQDITTQNEDALTHRNWDVYEENYHDIEFVSGSNLQSIYNGTLSARVNSIHHQAIKEPASGLEVEAHSKPDGIIEAVRLTSTECYARAIQWHPEWMDRGDKSLLDTRPLLEDFLTAVKKRMAHA